MNQRTIHSDWCHVTIEYDVSDGRGGMVPLRRTFSRPEEGGWVQEDLLEGTQAYVYDGLDISDAAPPYPPAAVWCDADEPLIRVIRRELKALDRLEAQS